MIYCIWYPSGGFGHYLNAIISLNGDNFFKPKGDLVFNQNGNSHEFPLAMPKYKDHISYTKPNLDPNKNYTVLIDNGINNESTNFLDFFPEACVIKMCYDDVTWPVVAKTHIIKAMKSQISTEMGVDPEKWPEQNAWAQREKIFLYLRDHPLRNKWKPDTNMYNLMLNDLDSHDKIFNKLNSFGIKLSSFTDTWQQWWQKNHQYFLPIKQAQKIIDSVVNRDIVSLNNIHDTWDQAVIYYFIWLRFQKEVPHNDYANFFENTAQIIDWVNNEN